VRGSARQSCHLQLSPFKSNANLRRCRSAAVGAQRALVMAWRRKSRHTLRITIQESEATTEIKLEGRLAGLWAAELARTWAEIAPLQNSRKLSIDLRNTTYADASGIRILRDIHSRTGAELVTSTPWTEYLAEEVTRTSANQVDQEP